MSILNVLRKMNQTYMMYKKMKVKLEMVQGDVNCISGNPSNRFFFRPSTAIKFNTRFIKSVSFRATPTHPQVNSGINPL